MSIVKYFSAGIGAADLGNGEYRIDLEDGTTRPATAEEIHAAAALYVAEQIKAERDRRKGAGCPVGGHIYHSDPDSRIQQIGLVMMGAAMPPGIMWKTAGSAFVEMTPTLAQQIFQAQAARDVALFSAAQAHIAAAMQAADPLTYDYSTGWPE